MSKRSLPPPVDSRLLFDRLKDAGAKAKLAKKLGIGQQVVTNWRHRGIPESMLRRVAAAINMTAEEYMSAIGPSEARAPYGKTILERPLTAEEPPPASSIPNALRDRLLLLFEKLMPDQQEKFLEKMAIVVERNIAISMRLGTTMNIRDAVAKGEPGGEPGGKKQEHTK